MSWKVVKSIPKSASFQFLLGCYSAPGLASSTSKSPLSIPFRMLLLMLSSLSTTVCLSIPFRMLRRGSSSSATALNSFNSFQDATCWGGEACRIGSILSIPFRMLRIYFQGSWRIGCQHFQFLLGCYALYRRTGGLARRRTFNSFQDATKTRLGRLLDAPGTAFNSFQDATRRQRVEAEGSRGRLSIPFRMLPGLARRLREAAERTFNSFQDATAYQILPPWKPKLRLSIPFRMLRWRMNKWEAVMMVAFNSFQDATVYNKPERSADSQRFQFLLGCYAYGNHRLWACSTTFNSFQDATQAVLCSL